MTVGKLKKLLEGTPDDALVVVSGRDHSYREASARLIDAAEESLGRRGGTLLSEWTGNADDYSSAPKVVKVIHVE